MSTEVSVLARRAVESYGSQSFPKLMADLQSMVSSEGTLAHLLVKYGLKERMLRHALVLKSQGRKKDSDIVKKHIALLFGKQYR